MNGELTGAVLVRAEATPTKPAWRIMAENLSILIGTDTQGERKTLVLELPQIYGKYTVSPGDPNDLLPLALLAGMVVGMVMPQKLHTYLPREWKGQTPKNVTKNRVLEILSVEELEKIELPKRSKTSENNVYDALGIGLKFLGRGLFD